MWIFIGVLIIGFFIALIKKFIKVAVLLAVLTILVIIIIKLINTM